MTRGRAGLAMVLVTLLWSLAGVVTRHVEAAGDAEVTFLRSASCALALVALLSLAGGGPLGVARAVTRGGRLVWLSGVLWAAMFTCFMLALTRTTTANALVTMAIAPLAAALLARATLGTRVPPRTAFACLASGAGIAWMHASGLGGDDGGRHLSGTLIALCVPLAAAANWTLIQRSVNDGRGGGKGEGERAPDMRHAVLLGALLSAAATLPFALPFHATRHDVGLLALLGVVQLALPCLLVVAVARALSAPEVALLSLLEVVFGVVWAWLGAGERPSASALLGGGVVLAALVANEALAPRARVSASAPSAP